MREGVDSGRNVIIEKCPYNDILENTAAGVLAVEDFFDRGGIL